MANPLSTAAPEPPTEIDFVPDAVAAQLNSTDAELSDLRRAVVNATGDPKKLLASLERAMDPDCVAEIAPRSYWHPNGFAKLILHVVENFRIRMHVWPAGTDRAGENDPHGHRWDFASVVLCGEGLSTNGYVESDTGDVYVRHKYVGNGRAGLTPTGNVRLVKSDPIEVLSGECHAVDTTMIHTVEPIGNDLVATLVVQGTPQVDETVVYCLPGRQPNDPFRATTPHEVRELIEQVCAVLRAEVAGNKHDRLRIE